MDAEACRNAALLGVVFGLGDEATGDSNDGDIEKEEEAAAANEEEEEGGDIVSGRVSWFFVVVGNDVRSNWSI